MSSLSHQESTSAMILACPACSQVLHVDPQYVGQVIHCPRCGGSMTVPPPRPQVVEATDAGVEAAPLSAPIVLAIVVGHAIAGFLLWLLLGGCLATLLVLTSAVVFSSIAVARSGRSRQVIWSTSKDLYRHWEATRAARTSTAPPANTGDGSTTVVAGEHAEPPSSAPTVPHAPDRTAKKRVADATSSGPGKPPVVPTKAPAPPPSSSAPPSAPVPRTPPREPLPVPRAAAGHHVSKPSAESLLLPPTIDGESPVPHSVARRGEPIPRRQVDTRPWEAAGWQSPPNRIPSLNQLGAQLPPAKVAFLGPGQRLRLDRATIDSPLVYATEAPQFGAFDASLVDGSLPVAPPDTVPHESLPYWPSYHDATPRQRCRYLDWLATGRSDPRTEIGYVFIYFYGLERRAIIDGADHVAIVQEVLRLRGIYRDCRSFQRYAQSFLWFVLLLTSQRRVLPDDLVMQIVATAERWDDESLGSYLAYLYQSNQPLNADTARIVAQHDYRTPTSVIIRRHEQRFRDLFRQKFQNQFPEGLPLRASKRSKALVYRPASPTLCRNPLTPQLPSLNSVADVLAVSSQFKPLVDIWNQCIEELRDYDRAHRKFGEVSAAAYESLPRELQTGDHPEFDRWFAVWQECENAEHVPIVPVARLAQLKGLPARTTLTKTQCRQILATADCLGIGVEPDARLTGKNYRSDDVVTLFFVESESEPDFISYQATAALLQVGLFLAVADGSVAADEVVAIKRRLEDQFSLTPNQIKRLEAAQLLWQHTRPDPGRLLASLRQRLSERERTLIGEYAVGIAAADQVVNASEMASLRRVFAGLGLADEWLNRLVQPITVAEAAVGASPSSTATSNSPPAATAQDFHLDLSTISRIMRDTQAVASILQEAMAVDDDASDEEEGEPAASGDSATISTENMGPTSEAAPVAPTTPPPSDFIAPPVHDSTNTTHATSPAAGLSARFQPFFTALVGRSEWPESEAKQLARQHGVMLSGAIEAINEWSHDRWGDWLIEEGDPLHIRVDLLERN